MAVIADNSAAIFHGAVFLSFGHDTARIAPGDFPAASPEPFARKILEQGRHAVLPGHGVFCQTACFYNEGGYGKAG